MHLIDPYEFFRLMHQHESRAIWRWLRRLAMLLIVLVVGVYLGGRILFMTDMPRRLAVSVGESVTGLRIHLGRLETGWDGVTRIVDLKVYPPMDDQPLLIVDRAVFEHVTILQLPFEGVRVYRAQVHQVQVDLTQNPHGQWNAVTALQVLKGTMGKSKSAGGVAPMALPVLELQRLVVNVQAHGDRTRQVALFDLQCRPRTADPYTNYFIAHMEDHIQLTGELALGAMIDCRGRVKARDLLPLVKQWGHVPLTRLGMDMAWRLQVLGDRVQLWSELEHLYLNSPLIGGERVASGRMHLTVDSSGGTVAMDQLVVRDLAEKTKLRLANLRLTSDLRQQVTLRSLALHIHDVPDVNELGLRLTGNMNLTDNSASLQGTWFSPQDPNQLIIGGSWQMNGQWPTAASPYFHVHVQGQSNYAFVGIQAKMDIGGRATSWDQLDCRVTFPELRVTARQTTANLDGVGFGVSLHQPVLSVNGLALPGAGWSQLKAEVNLVEHAWSTSLAVDKWQLKGTRWGAERLRFTADGDPEHAKISEGRLQMAGAEFQFKGAYTLKSIKPISGEASIRWTGSTRQWDRDLPDLSGSWIAGGRLEGDPNPMRFGFRLDGKLLGRNVELNRRPLGVVELPIDVLLDEAHISARSKGIEILGGRGDFWTRLELGNQLLTAGLNFEDLQLRKAARFAGIPDTLGGVAMDVGGTADGRFEMQNNMLVPGDIKVKDGSWRIMAPRCALTGAREVRGLVTLDQDRFRIYNITATQESATTQPSSLPATQPVDIATRPAGGRVPVTGSGRLSGSIEVDINEPLKWQLALNVQQWQILLPWIASRLSVSTQPQLTVDLGELSIQGSVPINGRLAMRDREVGWFIVSSLWNDRRVELTDLSGMLLDGRFRGTGSFHADDLLQSKLELGWERVNLGVLAELDGRLKGLGGLIGGSVRLERARPQPTGSNLDRWPLGPLLLKFAVNCQNAAYHQTQVGNIGGRLYLSPWQQGYGVRRAILCDTTIQIADGQLKPWLRLTHHQSEPFGFARIEMVNLSLLQIVSALTAADGDPSRQTVLGRLSGKVSFFGPLSISGIHAWSGGGTNLHIDGAAITSTKVGKFIAENMQTNPNAEDKGSGSAQFNLSVSGSKLAINAIHYQSPVVNILASVTLEDLLKGPQCPLDGQLVATTSPFGNLKIPVLKQTTEFLRQLQSNLYFFRLKGTVSAPSPSVEVLPNMTGGFRSFFVGFMNQLNQ